MNNKELQMELSKRLHLTQKQTGNMMNSFVAELLSQLSENEQVAFLGMGSLEVSKKEQRVLINPSTKQRMLVPPKLVLSFRPSQSYKLKFKSKTV